MTDKYYSNRKIDVRSHIEDTLFEFKKNKPQHDRLWYSSILFYRGEQWITFDIAQLRFRRSNQRRVIPRPVTNKYASIANSLISALVRFDPRNVFIPQTNTQEDVNTSMAGNRIINAIESEVQWDRRKSEIIPWLVLTGNAFAIPGVDPTRGPLSTELKMFCIICGLKEQGVVSGPDQMPDCPRCAEVDKVKVPLRPEVDAEGNPKTVEKNTGRLSVDIPSPFEMFLDGRITDINNHSRVIRIHNKDVQWVKAKWPDMADKIQPSKREELNARMQTTLSTLTYPSVETQYENTIDLIEMWEMPSDQFPKGFYAVLAGNEFLELRRYPWIKKNKEAYLPVVHFYYDRVPGTFWGRTPMFDLVEKQRTRNRVEAIGETILMRMSNPVWIAPNPGTTTVPSGHVGQIIYYDPHQSGGSAPQRVEAANLPPSFVNWLTLIDKDMQDIPGISEIVRGERPLSVKSGYAVQKLEEIARSRNTALYSNFTQSLAHFQTLAFEMFRTLNPSDRYSRILGDNMAWTVSKIEEADLAGGMDISVEPGSSVPRSHLEKLATLETLLQFGLLDIQDPIQRLRIYREYGMSDMLPSVDIDDQHIGREHDRFKQGVEIGVSPFDNHRLHAARHSDLLKSEYFETIPVEHRQVMHAHLQEHNQYIKQEEEAALQQQMMLMQGGGKVPQQ